MLAEPCQIRHNNLEDSLLLYTFYRDVDDELLWINEKRPIAAMEDLGSNLTSVQSLQKKHQVFMAEMLFFCDYILVEMSSSRHNE
jgi:spectrin beta